MRRPSATQPGAPTAIVEIERLGSDGAGVGRLDDGRVVFVHRTAPGDRVKIRLTEQRARWARGRLEEILASGPGRVLPPCPRYTRCGGCTLQHVDSSTRIEALQLRIVDALERIGKLARPIPPLLFHPAPVTQRYRNRATFSVRRLGFRDGAPQVVSGFHTLEGAGRIVDVGSECLLLEPALAECWDALRAGWGAHARCLPAGESLRLTLRTLADGSAVLLIDGGGGSGDPEALLAAVPGLRTIWHRPEHATGAARCVAGDPSPEETWFGEQIVLKPGAFLQVNRAGAAALYDLVMAELTPPSQSTLEPQAAKSMRGVDLLDAYCGFGVYGRAWARAGEQAVGIELDPQAVQMASDRPVEGFTLLEGAVEDRILEALPARQVVLNPPRTGAASAVMESLAGCAELERIVYVSCDPATLARDLARLGPSFRAVRLQAIDLFPQTAHVETVVTLEPVRSA